MVPPFFSFSPLYMIFYTPNLGRFHIPKLLILDSEASHVVILLLVSLILNLRG